MAKLSSLGRVGQLASDLLGSLWRALLWLIGLLRYWPVADMQGSPELTAYALAMTSAAGLPIPDEPRAKMVSALRDVVTALGLPAQVHAERAENCGDSLAGTADVVMARALASLTVLCGYAAPLIAKGAVGLFPKGQDVEAELTEASKYWNIEAELIPSLTNPEARIVRVTGLSKRGKKK